MTEGTRLDLWGRGLGNGLVLTKDLPIPCNI